MSTFFRIKGFVKRKAFVLPSVAFMTIEIDGERGKSYLDIKSFDHDVKTQMGELDPGDEVTIDGELMSEGVRVDKQPIKDSRGKPVFGIGLKATKITVAEAAKAKKAAAVATPANRFDDQDVPF